MLRMGGDSQRRAEAGLHTQPGQEVRRNCRPLGHSFSAQLGALHYCQKWGPDGGADPGRGEGSGVSSVPLSRHRWLVKSCKPAPQTQSESTEEGEAQAVETHYIFWVSREVRTRQRPRSSQGETREPDTEMDRGTSSIISTGPRSQA